MKENNTLISHLKDLAERSFSNNMYTFSAFLSESEISEVLSMKKEFSYAGMTIFGGTDCTDRCLVRFGNPTDLGYDQDFPIACLKIQPRSVKFSEALSHRDYLGSLMGLGIERELLGDIMIDGSTAYLFCLEHIADFIVEKLVQVRHTAVTASVLSEAPSAIKPRFESHQLIVSSPRLDAVIAKLYNMSRSQSLDLFKAGKVFVNGLTCENSSFACKDNDRISVRGFGKFIYIGIDGTTGKGRYRIDINVYV